VPIYEYKCANGHVFDVFQSMSDDPLTECEQCGAPVERVFHPVAVHFKGSGFYSTDYGAKSKAGGDGAAKEGASADGDKRSSESKDKKDKTPAKSDSGSSSSD
jgi:putative FmdB family regulatory protein